MTEARVWESADGGYVLGTGVNSIREFAEAIAAAERPLIEVVIDWEEHSAEPFPSGEDLILRIESNLRDIGVVAEAVPEELMGLEHWPEERLRSIRPEDEAEAGYVKVLSAFF